MAYLDPQTQQPLSLGQFLSQPEIQGESVPLKTALIRRYYAEELVNKKTGEPFSDQALNFLVQQMTGQGTGPLTPAQQVAGETVKEGAQAAGSVLTYPYYHPKETTAAVLPPAAQIGTTYFTGSPTLGAIAGTGTRALTQALGLNPQGVEEAKREFLPNILYALATRGIGRIPAAKTPVQEALRGGAGAALGTFANQELGLEEPSLKSMLIAGGAPVAIAGLQQGGANLVKGLIRGAPPVQTALQTNAIRRGREIINQNQPGNLPNDRLPGDSANDLFNQFEQEAFGVRVNTPNTRAAQKELLTEARRGGTVTRGMSSQKTLRKMAELPEKQDAMDLLGLTAKDLDLPDQPLWAYGAMDPRVVEAQANRKLVQDTLARIQRGEQIPVMDLHQSIKDTNTTISVLTRKSDLTPAQAQRLGAAKLLRKSLQEDIDSVAHQIPSFDAAQKTYAREATLTDLHQALQDSVTDKGGMVLFNGNAFNKRLRNMMYTTTSHGPELDPFFTKALPPGQAEAMEKFFGTLAKDTESYSPIGLAVTFATLGGAVARIAGVSPAAGTVVGASLPTILSRIALDEQARDMALKLFRIGRGRISWEGLLAINQFVESERARQATPGKNPDEQNKRPPYWEFDVAPNQPEEAGPAYR